MFYRVAIIVAGLVAAGVYWLYERLETAEAEKTSNQTNDEFVMNPPRLDQEVSPPRPVPKPPSLFSTPSHSTAKNSSPPENFDPDNLQMTAERVEERDVGPFHFEEFYFSDGSLTVQIHGDNGSAGIGMEPGEKEVYAATADLIISDCQSIPSGGYYCYDFLVGPRITFYHLYDDQWEEPQTGVISGVTAGGFTTYEDLAELKSE